MSVTYTADFKKNAIKYYLESNKSLRACAKDLKINYRNLLQWVRMANDVKRKSKSPPMSTAEMADIFLTVSISHIIDNLLQF